MSQNESWSRKTIEPLHLPVEKLRLEVLETTVEEEWLKTHINAPSTFTDEDDTMLFACGITWT